MSSVCAQLHCMISCTLVYVCQVCWSVYRWLVHAAVGQCCHCVALSCLHISVFACRVEPLKGRVQGCVDPVRGRA